MILIWLALTVANQHNKNLDTHKVKKRKNSLKAESKLAFWYLLAQRLGSSITNLPGEYKPTQQATQVLNSLESFKTEELVAFLKRVV